ncbi:MAG: TonB-dependent receptor, partial [Bacteroidales bacterium]|nr:TonB-dependent receptor [Bacteroidales bacterium]
FNAQFKRRAWSGFVDVEYVNSKGDYPFRYKSQYEDTIGHRFNSDIEYWRAEAALFNGGFASHLYFYKSERGCPGGVVRRLSDKYNNIGREWDTDLFAQASYNQLFEEKHHVKFTIKYAHEYLRYNTDFPQNQNTARVDNHYWQNDAYVSASYAWYPLRGLSFSTGYDARMSWLDADLKRFSVVRRLDQKAVVAGQWNWRGFRVAASVLYQHYRDHTQSHVGAADPLEKFTPAFTFGYQWRGLQIRAWYKSIFRAPTLNDLYYTQVGNRNLKPEFTKQWNIGVEYHFRAPQWDAGIQADAYINRIEDRIVCLPLKGTYTWSMLNYGETYCRGLNSTVNGAFRTGSWMFSLLTSFTLQRDLNRTDPESKSYNRPICYSPTFSCGITAIASWRWISLTVSELHVGSRMWSYADPDDYLRPYNNTDLRLAGQWRSFNASLEVNDLFDVQYEHIPRYPMPGRNFKFTIGYSF